MVQFLLEAASQRRARVGVRVALAFILLLTPAWAARVQKQKSVVLPPDLLLEGNRKLVFERSFESEKEVRGKPGFWAKVLNVVAGEPSYKRMARPYSIAVDSHGRAIVTDADMRGVHIFDFAQHKYKFLQRWDKRKDPMLTPQCVALDAQDNIYVTDSDSGKIFVFDANGKFQRVIGSLKGGEGFFKRPTGIAVDSAAQRIYVTDTLRDEVFVLDMAGSVLNVIGRRGTGNGEFNLPTEVLLHDHKLYVVDAMNFRVEIFDTDGAFRASIGKIGDGVGTMFRPKGISFDSEGHLYVVDAYFGMVQVFNSEGQLLYYFGKRGTALGQFQLPSGIFIDHNDRVFVVDSYNSRVQVFHYFGHGKQASGEGN